MRCILTWLEQQWCTVGGERAGGVRSVVSELGGCKMRVWWTYWVMCLYASLVNSIEQSAVQLQCKPAALSCTIRNPNAMARSGSTDSPRID